VRKAHYKAFEEEGNICVKIYLTGDEKQNAWGLIQR
jgi:hypothetical protein